MRLFALLIYLLPFGLYAESVTNFVIYDKQNNTCKCKTEIEDSSDTILLNAIKNKYIEDESFLACTHHCLARHYFRNQNYLEAIHQNNIALQIRKKNQDVLEWKSYYNLGYTYTQAGHPRKAISSFSEAMVLNKHKQKEVMPNIYISRCYREIGEYEKAINYAQIALELATTNELKGEAYNNLAIIYENMGDTESLTLAAKYARQAIQFYKAAQKIFKVANAYNNLANVLDRLKKYDEAIDNYNKALDIYTEDNVQPYSYILNNIAAVLNKQNKYNKAINLLNQSLELQQKYYDNATYHPDYFYNYEHLGDSYTGLGKYKKAIQNYDKALDNLKDNPKAENPYIYNKPDYIRILDLKAQALKMNGDIALAHQIYQYIDDWITAFYKDLSTNTSKLVWIERAHKIYGNAIEVALMNGDENRAFEYAEKAHAVLLWQNLSQEAALGFLTDEDREKRDDLIAQLHQAERQYQNGDIDISTLRAHEKTQQQFEAQLEDQNPEYARSKYQTESTTVEQVQEMIDENTVFLEYYWTDDVLRIFSITKKEITVHTETANGLTAQIAELRSIISTPKCDADCAKNDYNSLAFDLYKKLIPYEIQTNAEIDRLVIVADKAIGTLPFSALATQVSSENFNPNYPFLLNKYATNYLYSAGSFLQLQQKNTRRATGFAGFAPVEYGIADRDFLPLYKAEEEVEQIAKMYPSRRRKIYTNETATKQNFIDALQQNYHTVLLATHAQYKNQKGEIAFRHQVIDQSEIDQLSHIPVRRLILSACQTAEGKQNAGEGVLSLGWNFAYKGVSSITMNQWSVSENATMQIMVAYNDALRKGVPADQALKAAQINYLNGDIYTQKYYQPYYWAAIVHAGNPVDTKVSIHISSLGDTISTEHLWWILVALLLGLVWHAISQAPKSKFQ